MNAAFRKPALTDRDEGKHFTSMPLASEGLLCKEGKRERETKKRENESAPPLHPLSSSQEVSGAVCKEPNAPISCERELR